MGTRRPLFFVVIFLLIGSGTFWISPPTTPISAAHGEAVKEVQASSPVALQPGMLRAPLCANCAFANVSVGASPVGVGYDNDTGYVYIANFGSNSVSAICGLSTGCGSHATNTVATAIAVGSKPYGIAYDTGDGYLYIANSGSGNVSVLCGRPLCGTNRTNDLMKTIPVGKTPSGVVYDSKDGYVYVTNAGSNNVSEICGLSAGCGVGHAVNTLIGTTYVGTNPIGIGYDGADGYLYVANYNTNNVSVICGVLSGCSGPGFYSVNQVAANLRVGTSPYGVVNDSGDGYLYVTNQVSNNVSVICGLSAGCGTGHAVNTILKAIPAGIDPEAVTYDRADGYLYVANYGYGFSNVSVVCGLSGGCGSGFAVNAPITSIPVGINPDGIAYDSFDGSIYVANYGSNTVSVIRPPGLSSVMVNPSSATLNIYYPLLFVATPSCTNGSCKGVVTYSWSLTNTLGTLNSTISNPVLFTAGGTPGIVTLFVNVTLNGTTVPASSVPITIVPTLSSVTVSPSPAVLNTGSAKTLTANLTCSGGPCPGGATYSWSLTNTTFGALNSSTANPVRFTAGNLSGMLALFLNVTLNYITQESSPVTITINPQLLSVSVSPASVALNTQETQAFNTILACNGGNCPSGATYSWSLTNSLGSLNHTTGHPVFFTAGSKGGVVSLFVNVTLNGVIQQSSPVTILIRPKLASVAVSPPSASLKMGGVLPFTAIPTCNGGSCPSGSTYAWNVTNGSLGKLNANVSSTVYFTAGNLPGQLALFVNVTLNGITVRSLPVLLTINPKIVSVTVTPSSTILNTGDSRSFLAIPTCIGGPCPFTVIYSWSLTNTLLGTLTPTAGSATFVAGRTAGALALFVNVTLNGVTQQSAPVPITINPKLAYVTVNPSSAALNTNNTLLLVANPYCTGGTGGSCPSGITYSWNLTNASLGQLSSNSSHAVHFNAGNIGGSLALFVNVSLNGVKVESPAVPITISPELVSVVVRPSSVVLNTGSTKIFMVTIACTGGPCPGGATYSWSLTNNLLGKLNLSTANPVLFTTGNTVGVVVLFVNVSLNEVTIGAAVPITINPKLVSVAVSPTSALLTTGTVRVFVATLACTGGEPCPGGATFSWSLSNASLGTLSDTTAVHLVRFMANNTPGNVSLFLNVTLNGVTVASPPSAIMVLLPLTIVSFTASPAIIYLGGATTFTLSPSGGTKLYTYTYVGLPPGCTSSNASSISCTPTTSGSFIVRGYVNDSASAALSQTVTLTVISPPPPNKAGGDEWLVIASGVVVVVAGALFFLWWRKPSLLRAFLGHLPGLRPKG